MRELNLILKRIGDVICSFLAIVIFSPLLLVVALLIKLTSEGPVFFLQERIGKNGKVFKIIKFRTMIVNAEKIGDGIFVFGNNDSRITKVGRFLRKTSLDELPQLFNVLFSNMSIVGPRPPVTYHPYNGYENYPEWTQKRFDMKPGITGLAQVRTRTTAPWDKRIEIDNEYVQGFNIFLDIKIIFLTVLAVLGNKNIYPESKEQIQGK